MTETTVTTRRGEFLAGARATLPLIVGAIPFGIIFGAVAITSGLSPAGALSMSLFVFAGAAQFIAAGLIAAGVGGGLIILTTFIVNLRHALYGASLSPYMKHLPQRWLLPLGFWLTDESYAVVISRYHQSDDSPHKHWFFLGSAVLMYVNWQLCTLIGITAGQAVPDARGWGLDFAMVVTFIGIVVPLVRTRPMLVAVIVAGGAALLFHDLPSQMGLMVAALLGIAAGYIAETRAAGASAALQPGEEPR
jgi:4-azaleucine resistance transporter AzlC